MSILLNTAWAYPLFLWNTPQSEIKNGFYRFTLGLSTILWGIACIILFFNLTEENLYSSMSPAIASLLIIGAFTAFIWNKVNNSLSSSFAQKISDAYKVYYVYENFNFFKSIFYLIKLSLLSIKRKF